MSFGANFVEAIVVRGKFLRANVVGANVLVSRKNIDTIKFKSRRNNILREQNYI